MEKDLKCQDIVCNLCGGSDVLVEHKRIDAAEDLPLEKKYSAAQSSLCTDRVVRCKACGLVYISPRIGGTTILDSVASGDDKEYVSQREGRMNTFRENIGILERYSGKKGMLLDVGAAAGFFVKVAKESGWDAIGVEPNGWLAEYGRGEMGQDIRTGTIDSVCLAAGSLDAITMWDVLEHMTDPKSAIKKANIMLKKEGIILVCYPDHNSIFSRVLGRRWWFFLSHHLYYFTPKTIERMLNEEGFNVVGSHRLIQKLKIGYMLAMASRLLGKGLIGSFFSGATGITKAVGLSNLNIPYYGGQRIVVAIKK
jgi:hypothetical protein